MILSVDGLKDMGAFTGPPVKKEITWQQGEQEFTAEVFVRRLSYHSAINDLRSLNGSKDPVAGRIAASICDEGGNPIFTPGDITGEADPIRGALDANLTMALLTAITEVNGAGKIKPSAKKTKSGTS